MDQYLPILLLVVLSIVFAVATFMNQRALGPGGHLNPAKTGPYESGIAARREPSARFPVRFYLVAMIFIIFDIEVVFLYPFAVVFHALSLFGFIEMASFALVVFLAFAYLISEGALDWGPAKRLGSRSGAPVNRTINSTVRRVRRPGVSTPSRASAPGTSVPPRPRVPVGAGVGTATGTIGGTPASTGEP